MFFQKSPNDGQVVVSHKKHFCIHHSSLHPQPILPPLQQAKLLAKSFLKLLYLSHQKSPTACCLYLIVAKHERWSSKCSYNHEFLKHQQAYNFSQPPEQLMMKICCQQTLYFLSKCLFSCLPRCAIYQNSLVIAFFELLFYLGRVQPQSLHVPNIDNQWLIVWIMLSSDFALLYLRFDLKWDCHWLNV